MIRRIVGSPPQVRGKPVRRAGMRLGHGITPAGAGKTQPEASACEDGWDHPRRCGENTPTITQERNSKGSPPQVRGKLEDALNSGSLVGITPAGAGKTFRSNQNQNQTQDHPRRCGENAKQRERIQGDLGSPPQVRGKPKSSE